MHLFFIQTDHLFLEALMNDDYNKQTDVLVSPYGIMGDFCFLKLKKKKSFVARDFETVVTYN